jgi:hypothetical protein
VRPQGTGTAPQQAGKPDQAKREFAIAERLPGDVK